MSNRKSGAVRPHDRPRARPAPVVRIAGVDKTFSRGDHVVTKALEGIDLDVARGEFVSLIGPSGCGKSTLAPDRRRPDLAVDAARSP